MASVLHPGEGINAKTPNNGLYKKALAQKYRSQKFRYISVGISQLEVYERVGKLEYPDFHHNVN